MTTQVVRGGGPLLGEVRTPGDKSISHRALLLGALAEGTSAVTGISDGDDVARTRAAVAALGAEVVDDGATVRITGGRSRLRAPAGPIDCGNSGTGMRLLAGVVATLPGDTVLVGDESLSARPMDRVAEPLRLMGAGVAGRTERVLPPLTVSGGRLAGIEWTPPVASAQVKSCVLLAGLGAEGETVVVEPVPTRAHTEEMLLLAGADLAVEAAGAGVRVTLRPGPLHPFTLTVPGDPSQAAFWVVAATIVSGSEVTVRHVYGGPHRSGYLDVLRRMGADLAVEPSDAGDGAVDVTARHAALGATVVEAAEIPSLDEVPILAVAAAVATGTTVFRDVAELRVKEVDRLEATIALVTAYGAEAEADGDDLRVTGTGGGALAPGTTDCRGDHRMAMAAAVAALAAPSGPSTIAGFDAVATSYPGFLGDLRTVAGTLAAPGPGDEGPLVVAIDGPAGSGKSTVSARVAERLGLPRLDTGAMYRAVAWAALDRGIDPADRRRVADLARAAELDVGHDRAAIDGTDVTDAIRTPAVSAAVSIVAANPDVRRSLVRRQRRWVAEHGGGVVEGRDIASTVFPQARLKVFLTASPEERARRRAEEPPDGVRRRDHLDSTRAASPLTQAPGARALDTTGRSIEDVVEEVLSWL